MLNFLLQDAEESVRFLDLKLFDTEDFTDLVIRSLFNFIIVFILIKFIYRSDKKNKNYAFSFYLFSMIIFFLCYLLSGREPRFPASEATRNQRFQEGQAAMARAAA